MNGTKFNGTKFQSLKGKRTVMLLGNLIFFYPLVIEDEGVVTVGGAPARPLKDEEVLAALNKIKIGDLRTGLNQSMLTFRWMEILPINPANPKKFRFPS